MKAVFLVCALLSVVNAWVDLTDYHAFLKRKINELPPIVHHTDQAWKKLKSWKDWSDPRVFNPPDDMTLSFERICDKNGFLFEQHSIVTEDEYVLSLFRIPGLKRETNLKQSVKSPLYFQHGIADSADCFVMNTAENSPAFIAASAGYDVWLGNLRGNKYSRKHLTLDPDTESQKFFDFTFTDNATKDVMEAINYIKKVTRSQKVGYVGHSMGTTIMFYLASIHQVWVAQTISVFVALAPITMPLHATSPLIKTLAPQLQSIKSVLDFFSVYELFSQSANQRALEIVCGYLPAICERGASWIASSNMEPDDQVRFQVYIGGHYPSGTSTKTIYHYAQMIKDNKFQEYCYGPAENLSRYGQPDPPEISLERIQQTGLPVLMQVFRDDELSNPRDTRDICDRIGTSCRHYQEYDGGHQTPLIGKDSRFFKETVVTLLQVYHPTPQILEVPYLDERFLI